MTKFLAVGLMSGTSMDGIDAALLETDGEYYIQEHDQTSIIYDAEFKILLKSAERAVWAADGDLTQAAEQFSIHLQDYLKKELHHDSTSAVLAELYFYLHQNKKENITLHDVVVKSTQLHARAVQQLLSKQSTKTPKIAVIGYHGQTLFHSALRHKTVQVGFPQQLADEFKIPVVGNFRDNDMQQGGQGAPLAAIYHQGLAIRDRCYPIVVVNCGGIANLTAIYGKEYEDMMAFDTGPGNGLIDRLVRQKTAGKEHMDQDGRYGLKGKVNQTVLELLLQQSCLVQQKNFYQMPPPKSLDIRDFHLIPEVIALSLEDGCATLAALTAKTLVDSLDLISRKQTITKWVLSGGGWRNPVIVRELNNYLQAKIAGSCQIVTAEEIGWNSSALEAQLFAYLAVRCLRQLPISFPTTTGVPYPLVGGKIYHPFSSLDEETRLHPL